MSWTLIAAFAAASLPLVLAPGPSVAFVLATTLGSGRRAGLGAVAGVETGYLVHVGAAVVGVSAVIAASAQAFTVVKLLGAGYLIWLGIQAWRSRDQTRLADLARSPAVLSAGAAFRRGLLVGALNPKTAVFFVAFLPQFVDPSAGPVWVQMTGLGLLFIVLAAVPDTCWALAGSALPKALPNVRMTLLHRISGTVYLALAGLALTARRSGA